MSAVSAQQTSASMLASFEDDERTRQILQAPLGPQYGGAGIDGQDHDLEFEDLPPFPTDVPTVPLLRISLRKLVNGEQAELDRLWKACCEIGFFYLDLRDGNGDGTTNKPKFHEHRELIANPWGASTPKSDGSQTPDRSVSANGVKDVDVNGERLLRDAYSLFAAAEEFFALPLSEKQNYDFRAQNSYHGYKGQGGGIIDKEGNKDRNEFYNISKDDILGLTKPLPAPDILSPRRELFESYIKHSHAIVILILRLLNARLDLPPDKLPSIHRLSVLTGDQVRWVHAPPQPADDRRTALGAHSDFGSVTILFNRLGGLQVLPPKLDEWSYVKPLKGHAVVNLGDAMVKFSAGILRSNIHRVVSPPGEQADLTRLSLVYFARPEEDILLRALKESRLIAESMKSRGIEGEEEITSKDWILRRALGRRGATGEDFEKALGTEDYQTKERK